MTAVFGLTALVVGLAAVDVRVREQIAMIVSGRGTTSEVATAGSQIQGFMAIVAQAVRDQSMEHAALVTFGVVALVLVLFMLRT